MEYTVIAGPTLGSIHVEQSYAKEPVSLPDLLQSEKSSSQPLSLLPSPEVSIPTSISLSKTSQFSNYPDSQCLSSRFSSKDMSANRVYSRVSISSLVNPTPQSDCRDVAQSNDRKRCLSPTLEKTLRFKIPKNFSSKYNFNTPSTGSSLISCLVDLSVMTIESIWGPDNKASSNSSRESLHVFVTELFRRSQVSKAVVQLALVFCLRTQSTLSAANRVNDPFSSAKSCIGNLITAFCGRRLFLGSLICASKYLQDTNFSNSTWAKIVGLPSADISFTERIFLQLVNYRLFVHDFDFYPYACRILQLSSLRAPVPSALGQVVRELFFRS